MTLGGMGAAIVLVQFYGKGGRVNVIISITKFNSDRPSTWQLPKLGISYGIRRLSDQNNFNL